MSIRRPPTALGLTATDVAELTAKLSQERQARAAQQQPASGQHKLDAVLEREKQEREKKEGMRQDDRVGV